MTTHHDQILATSQPSAKYADLTPSHAVPNNLQARTVIGTIPQRGKQGRAAGSAPHSTVLMEAWSNTRPRAPGRGQGGCEGLWINLWF